MPCDDEWVDYKESRQFPKSVVRKCPASISLCSGDVYASETGLLLSEEAAISASAMHNIRCYTNWSSQGCRHEFRSNALAVLEKLVYKTMSRGQRIRALLHYCKVGHCFDDWPEKYCMKSATSIKQMADLSFFTGDFNTVLPGT
jgi:hypothetical protein